MLSLLITVSVFVLSGTVSAQNTTKIPSFKHVLVDGSGPASAHSKTVGDIDGDGQLDLVVAGTQGSIVWYQYPSWKKNIITESGGGWSTDVEVGDINRDGRNDIVVPDFYTNDQIV